MTLGSKRVKPSDIFIEYAQMTSKSPAKIMIAQAILCSIIRRQVVLTLFPSSGGGRSSETMIIVNLIGMTNFDFETFIVQAK